MKRRSFIGRLTAAFTAMLAPFTVKRASVSHPTPMQYQIGKGEWQDVREDGIINITGQEANDGDVVGIRSVSMTGIRS